MTTAASTEPKQKALGVSLLIFFFINFNFICVPGFLTIQLKREKFKYSTSHANKNECIKRCLLQWD